MFDYMSILSSMVHKRKRMSAVTAHAAFAPTDPQRGGPTLNLDHVNEIPRETQFQINNYHLRNNVWTIPDKFPAAKCLADAPKEGAPNNLDYTNEMPLQTFFRWKSTFWRLLNGTCKTNHPLQKKLPDASKIWTLKHFLSLITLRELLENNCKWRKIFNRILYYYNNSFCFTNRFVYYYFHGRLFEINPVYTLRSETSYARFLFFKKS